MANNSARERRIRAAYRKKAVITGIVCLLIGLVAGFICGKVLGGNRKDASISVPAPTAVQETEDFVTPEPLSQNGLSSAAAAYESEPDPIFVFSDEQNEKEEYADEYDIADVGEFDEEYSDEFGKKFVDESGEEFTNALNEDFGEDDEEESVSLATILDSMPTEPPYVTDNTAEAAEEAAVETADEEITETAEEEIADTTSEPTPEPTPIIVPYGEEVTFDSQINKDGSPRRDTASEDYETINLTVQITSYKDFAYFEENYGSIYDLKGGTAAAEFEMTLNNYAGTQQIIPQNCLLITFRGDSDAKTAQGYQLIDKEIAGSTGVMLINNKPVTCYKRYAYDEMLGEMKYMVLTAYNDGVETTYWFDIDMPEPDPTPTPEPTPVPDVSRTLHPGEKSDAIKEMQEALIAQGYLDAEATGYYGQQTMNAVKAAQKAFGLTVDGVAGKQFFSKLYNMEIN